MKFRASQIEERLLREAAEITQTDYLWWGQGSLEEHFVAPPRSMRFKDYGRGSYFRWLWVVLDSDSSADTAFLVVFDPRVDAFGVGQKRVADAPVFFGFRGTLAGALGELYEAQGNGLPPVAFEPFHEPGTGRLRWPFRSPFEAEPEDQ